MAPFTFFSIAKALKLFCNPIVSLFVVPIAVCYYVLVSAKIGKKWLPLPINEKNLIVGVRFF